MNPENCLYCHGVITSIGHY